MRESAVLVQGLGWHCRICFVEAEEPSQHGAGSDLDWTGRGEGLLLGVS